MRDNGGRVMNEGKNAMEVVWEWIKLNEPKTPNPNMRFQFNTQEVSGTGGDGLNP
jgi:hypothetical protein